MAIRITRVYTRSGDRGETALVGGRRVSKDAARIEAYGTIDELNSIVGLARVFNEKRVKADKSHAYLEVVLRDIQQELFDVGAELATPPDRAHPEMHRIGEAEIRRLERIIDECQKDLAPLKSFILPGGGKVGAYLHQCRTVCRRAERAIVRLRREEEVSAPLIAYMNRLSDLFFVLSRWIAQRSGEKEYLWERGLKEKVKKQK